MHKYLLQTATAPFSRTPAAQDTLGLGIDHHRDRVPVVAVKVQAQVYSSLHVYM